MTTLNEYLDNLTSTVLSGSRGLDEALRALEVWIDQHAGELTPAQRQNFSATLDQESTNDTRSLIDSVLKLHTARLLYRYDAAQETPAPSDQTEYRLARYTFEQALRHSDDIVNEARIDVAIANAHHLLGDIASNRRWLDTALARLPDLAATDLVAMAQGIPPMPPPTLNVFKRFGLKLIGFNFDRLAQHNQDSLVAIAHMQTNQIITLAHLIGVSFETINERRRAKRALRVAAHLIVRHQGMPFQQDTEQLLDMADTMQSFEPEAARMLAVQARALYTDDGDDEGLARATSILEA